MTNRKDLVMQIKKTTAAHRLDDAGVPRWLVEAIARDLWRLCARNGTLDWAAVERHLEAIVEQAVEQVRTEAAASSADSRLGAMTSLFPL